MTTATIFALSEQELKMVYRILAKVYWFGSEAIRIFLLEKLTPYLFL